MSNPDSLVPFQVPIRKRTRQRLKNLATNNETTMAVLADGFIDFCAGLMEAGGKVPPALTAAIEKAKAAERAKKGHAPEPDDSGD